jgi:hypothetical protein
MGGDWSCAAAARRTDESAHGRFGRAIFAAPAPRLCDAAVLAAGLAALYGPVAAEPIPPRLAALVARAATEVA